MQLAAFPSSQDSILIIIILKWAQPRSPWCSQHHIRLDNLQPWAETVARLLQTHHLSVQMYILFFSWVWISVYCGLRYKDLHGFRIKIHKTTFIQTKIWTFKPLQTYQSVQILFCTSQSWWNWSHIGACPTSPLALYKCRLEFLSFHDSS